MAVQGTFLVNSNNGGPGNLPCELKITVLQGTFLIKVLQGTFLVNSNNGTPGNLPCELK